MLIAAIGDSLTYGFPYTPRQSWVYAIAARLGVKTVNKGVCGETTGEMAWRFGTDVVALKPETAIIMGGSNDAFSGIGAAEVAGNIRFMAEQAKLYHINPVVGLPIPCNYPGEEALLTEYRQWMRDYCTSQAIAVIDFYTPLLGTAGGLRTELQVDGVHPNTAGYLVMADAAATVLAAMIQEEKRK